MSAWRAGSPLSERVAVLSVGGVLLVTVPADLDESTVVSLQEELSARIVEKAAHGVVIDIAAVGFVDTFVGRRLSLIAAVAVLLGARPVLVGMRPAVALTLVHLGVELNDIAKARDLEAGLSVLSAPGTDLVGRGRRPELRAASRSA
ncbi:STAS domain-containing protein [Streptomyces sp. NPDC057287]|uniref:STAS domain-containing protein n=1 Tax=Streptomyces sp. NPDC057287 TaxID=3346086 RepID=UPI00362965C1